MVRMFVATLFVLCLAVPALAQDDDYPRLETTMGYGNIGLPNASGGNDRHSGFVMYNGFNLTRWFGIENFTGFYGAGAGATLITNIVGGKVMYRRDHAVPYAVAGIGGAYFTQGSNYSGTILNTRLGGGVDLPLGDSLGIKLEVTRMSFHSGGWLSNWSFGTGITFNISN